jgi:hypothetical protein
LTCFDDNKQNTPHPEGLYLWAAGNSLAGDRPPPLFQIEKATKAPSLLEAKNLRGLYFSSLSIHNNAERFINCL